MSEDQETPEDVVRRELQRWQVEQSFETALVPGWQESEKSRRKVSLAATALRNLLLEEIEQLHLYQYEKQRLRDAQLQKAFPRLTWRDIWLSLWGC